MFFSSECFQTSNQTGAVCGVYREHSDINFYNFIVIVPQSSIKENSSSSASVTEIEVVVEEMTRSGKKSRGYQYHYPQKRHSFLPTTNIERKTGSIGKAEEATGSESLPRGKSILHSNKRFSSRNSFTITTKHSGRRCKRAHLRRKATTKINLATTTGSPSHTSESNGDNKYNGYDDKGKNATAKSSNFVSEADIDELANLFGKLSIVDAEEELLPYLSRTEINAGMKQNIADVLKAILKEMEESSATSYNNRRNNDKVRKDQQTNRGKWLLRNYM